ncbi:MAG: hypothetical protein U0527_06010 [Candidatus Eisenbacteria bacterium]
MNAATHYRELHLDTPCSRLFAAGSYYASLRATTAVPDFGAVLLWMACAPHDSDLDYEMINVGCRSGFGWTAYNAIPSSPCPADFDFGLQVMRLPGARPSADGGGQRLHLVDPSLRQRFVRLRPR